MRRKKRRLFSFNLDKWIEKKLDEDREKLFQEIEKDVVKDFKDPYYYSDSYESIYDYFYGSWTENRKSYLDYRKKIETIFDLFTDRIINFS